MERAILTAVTADLHSITIKYKGYLITLRVTDNHVTAYKNMDELNLENIEFNYSEPIDEYVYIELTISHKDGEMKFMIKVPEFSWKKCKKTLENIQSALHPPHEETTDGEAKAPEPTNSGGDVAGSSVSLRL